MKEGFPYTRVDLFEMPAGGVRVYWYHTGWERKMNTPPATNHINSVMSLAEMVSWLDENGWTVRTWPKGARGFLGSPHPIRTRYEIKKKRSHFERFPPPELEGIIHALDFAFDC